MRLPDFTQFPPLNQLRELMAAELRIWSPFIHWDQFTPDEWKKLNTIGIDVNIEDVVPAEDGTLEYKGQKIVVYIRDQRISIVQTKPGGGYRFHIADCKTLQDMRAKGRYERYVVSTRKDGRFVVNRVVHFGYVVEREVECEIPVCKNCLDSINYANYRSEGRETRYRIWTSFSLIEYFDKYTSRIRVKPTYTEKTAPLDDYSSDWDAVSSQYRDTVDWGCEKCGLVLRDHKAFLHVHHKNGVRSDNRRENLKALCIKCHAEEPNHDHVRNSPDYDKFIRQFR